jgi:hypothetical protein
MNLKDHRSPEGQPIPRRTLPPEAPQRMWGGSGSGAPCAICGEHIGVDQLEYELEYRCVGNPHGRPSFHVHVRCCPAWELEQTGLRLSGSKG